MLNLETEPPWHDDFSSSFCHSEPQHVPAREWPDASTIYGDRALIKLRSARGIISASSVHFQEETKLGWIRSMAQVTIVDVSTNNVFGGWMARTKPGDSGV
jgi:hypothetical protein